VVSRSDNALRTAAAIDAAGGLARPHVGSVADEDFSRSVIEAARPDVVVNAAAVLGPSGRFDESTIDELSEVIDVNLIGTCAMTRWALSGMIEREYGRIVNFAGGGAAYSYPGFVPYALSKVAVVRFTEIVADELSSLNVDVTINVIAPGAVETDMLAEVRRSGGEVRTVTGVEEPVRLVAFLVSGRSSHISGRFIHSRDAYEDSELFRDPEMMKLRRTERL